MIQVGGRRARFLSTGAGRYDQSRIPGYRWAVEQCCGMPMPGGSEETARD